MTHTETTNLFYQPSEPIFGPVARRMVGNGWSVFPQSSEGRFPGRIFQEPIKWAGEHDLKNRLPTDQALKLWISHCSTLNVATVFGPASGHTFALDVDVMDPVLSAQIVALADEILGYTPFRREGREPKLALIYRHSEEDVVPSVSRRLAVGDDHMVEILGAGKLLTFHGKHHKTGRYFKWADENPILSGPGSAPLVTSDQVKTFLEAVDARWRFATAPSSTSGGAADYRVDVTDMSGVRVPRFSTAAGGKLTDGRWAHLSRVVYRVVVENAPAILAANEQALSDLTPRLAAAALVAFTDTVELTGSRWTAENAEREVRSNLWSTIQRLRSGALKVRVPEARAPTTTGPQPLVRFTHSRPHRSVVRHPGVRTR